MNPIIDREILARWRKMQSFGLVLAWAAVFMCAIYLFYCSYADQIAHTDSTQFLATTQSTGRQLFSTLSTAQAGAWMLLAPMLTATSIAGERERGLLESLQLSRLRSSQIVLGKLFSSLAFMVLLMVAALPGLAVCFVIGGVTPSQFWMVALLQLVTAFCGASIGIFFSSRARRALAALTQSVLLVVGWLLLMMPLLNYAGYMSYSSKFDYIPTFGLWTNPVMAAYAMTSTSAIQPRSATAAIFPPGIPPWAFTFAFQILFSLVLIFLAVRKVRKPLPEIVPTDKRWSDKRQARIRQRAAERAAAREKQRMAEKAQGALFYDLPLDKFIRFRNPVLQREVRGGFRWRGGSGWRTALHLGILIAGGCGFLLGLFTVTDPASRGGSWRPISMTMLCLIMLASAVMGAKGFTREREGGTWEGLYLSLLKPRETLWGKAAAPLVVCFYYSLPAWLLLAFCVDYSDGATTRSSYLSLSQIVALFFLFAATAWCYTTWGLLISRFCKRTATSVVCTIVSLLFILAVLPIFMESVAREIPYIALIPSTLLSALTGRTIHSVYYQESWNVAQSIWHPVGSLNYLQGAGLPPETALLLVYVNALVLFATGCVLLMILGMSMRYVDGFDVQQLRKNSRGYLKFRWK